MKLFTVQRISSTAITTTTKWNWKYLVEFCTQSLDAIHNAGCSLGFEQRRHCHWDTRQTLLHRYNTGAHLYLAFTHTGAHLYLTFTQTGTHLYLAFTQQTINRSPVASQQWTPCSTQLWVIICHWLMVLSLLQCCHTDGHHLSQTHGTELASVLSHWWPSSVTDSWCWACFSAVTLMAIICHRLIVLSLLQCCHTDGHHLSLTHGAELASVLSHWWSSSVTDS